MTHTKRKGTVSGSGEFLLSEPKVGSVFACPHDTLYFQAFPSPWQPAWFRLRYSTQSSVGHKTENPQKLWSDDLLEVKSPETTFFFTF